jgi:hypothetical protein
MKQQKKKKQYPERQQLLRPPTFSRQSIPFAYEQQPDGLAAGLTNRRFFNIAVLTAMVL